MVLLEQVCFQNVSCSTHSIPCIVLKSRIDAKNGPGTRNNQWLAGNVGRSRADRCLKFVKLSCVGKKINLAL